MKVIALFATINAGALAFAPQASPRFATILSARKDEVKSNNSIIGGAVAFFAGLATAGQIALADPTMLVDNTVPVGTIRSIFIAPKSH